MYAKLGTTSTAWTFLTVILMMKQRSPGSANRVPQCKNSASYFLCNMWLYLGKPGCSEFYEILVSCILILISYTLELTYLQVCFALELERFVCDRVTPTMNEKLRSKGIAMHTYSVSVYYAWTGNQLNGLGQSRSKWTQRSNLSRTSSITRAASSSIPKKLKSWVNVQ